MARHIVIVEDDLTLRYAYAKLLESQGYVVHQFADYRGVTELFDGGTGDLLITDIVLPTGTPHGIALEGGTVAPASSTRWSGMSSIEDICFILS